MRRVLSLAAGISGVLLLAACATPFPPVVEALKSMTARLTYEGLPGHPGVSVRFR